MYIVIVETCIPYIFARVYFFDSKKKKKKDQIKKERLFEKNKICSKFRVKNLKLKHESFDKVVFIYESLGNKTFSEIDKLL